MNRIESLALINQCEAARRQAYYEQLSDDEAHDKAVSIWNAWAKELISRRENLEESGRWSVKEVYDGRQEIPHLSGNNEETYRWLKEAEVDLSFISFVRWEEDNGSRDNDDGRIEQIPCFRNVLKFSGYLFPGNVFFHESEFNCETNFNNIVFKGISVFDRAVFYDNVSFEKSIFYEKASFKNASYHEESYFHSIEFFKDVIFDESKFSNSVFFRDTFFKGNTQFQRGKFSETATFFNATFVKNVSFESCKFDSQTEFTESEFYENTDFSNSILSGDASFKSAIFYGNALFIDTVFENGVNFRDIRIEGSAQFTQSIFNRNVEFNSAVFNNITRFSNVKFGRYTGFEDVTFKKDVWFRNSRFEEVKFDDAVFNGKVFFVKAIFSGPSYFERTKFFNDGQFRKAEFNAYISFFLVKMHGLANFNESIFRGKANFSAVNCLGAFTHDKARFVSAAPDFIQAHFSEAPRLDNLDVPKVDLWKGAQDKDEAAWFLALRRLAIQGHDHEREQKFFASELRARRSDHHLRFRRDWPDPVGRFVAGMKRESIWSILYDLLSNFGKSVIRPVIIWTLLVPLFGITNAYWIEGRTDSGSCPDRFVNGMLLSLENGLLLLGGNQTIELQNAYRCLYGVNPDGTIAVPAIVGFIGLFQGFLSAILVFLVILALRNIFRIK